MTYKTNFCVWLSNDLNTLPDPVSISLDETNHHFFSTQRHPTVAVLIPLSNLPNTYTLSVRDIMFLSSSALIYHLFQP